MNNVLCFKRKCTFWKPCYYFSSLVSWVCFCGEKIKTIKLLRGRRICELGWRRQVTTYSIRKGREMSSISDLLKINNPYTQGDVLRATCLAGDGTSLTHEVTQSHPRVTMTPFDPSRRLRGAERLSKRPDSVGSWFSVRPRPSHQAKNRPHARA
jgi:hypothetical protein